MKKNNILDLPFMASATIADTSKNWQSILFSILLLGFESLILYLYLIQFINVIFFIILHCIALLLLVRFAFYAAKQNQDLRYPLLLLASTLGAGAFGVAGFILVWLLYPLYFKFSTPFMNWFRDLFPQHDMLTTSYLRIKSGWDDYSRPHQITPFQDIFTYGTLLHKQAVLDAIVKEFDPVVAPILKRALRDSSNGVRIQAAAIIAKIDFDFTARLKRLLQSRANAPNNPLILLKLAEHFDAYAHTGLLDSAREKESQERALAFYQEYLQKSPEDMNAWIAKGRLLVRMGDFEGVIRWFEEQKDKGIPAKAYLWYLEALYMLHRYEELEANAKEHYPNLEKESLPSEFYPSLAIWAKATQPIN